MADFVISRSTHVVADPEVVRACVDDFHEWVAWSPWEGSDPDLQRTYSGAERGTGARYEWRGNAKAGQGSMVVTCSTPQQVDVDLAFLKPFKATNQVTFALVSSAQGGTDVTWTMRGTRGVAGQVFAKVLRLDDKLGGDFERGLVQLKALAEERAKG
ncbi:SRPBCC family protein [Janibacter sp. UYMM211]|uniref:SRPBCC family protein n=1 Tax=Janibacter sp. UYMM211 TaxID=3156342 RepID=UPI003399BBD1